MDSRFRPRFESLEGRDVPAAFSFQLSDGEIGNGSFTTPESVSAAEATQTFALTDLVVSVHGKTMTSADLLEDGGIDEDGVATARFSYGVLVEVYAEYRVPDTTNDEFRIVHDEARWSPSPYPIGAATGAIAFDGADVQADFTLPGDVTGALSYAIPWDSVDATLASQSVALTTFNLNMAGQNFAYGSANFTTAPTAQFAYGQFTGLSYAINTATATGFGYSSISQSGMNITVVPNVGQPIQTVAAIAQDAIVLDFTDVTTGKAHMLRIDLLKLNGDRIEVTGLINVSATATTADIVDAVATSLGGSTKFKVTVDGKKVKITANSDLGWSKVEYSTLSPTAQADNTIKPPKYVFTIGLTDYTVNGTSQFPR